MERKSRASVCTEWWFSEEHWSMTRFRKRWRPPTDVYETDVSIVIKVEVAGMAEDDFIVQFDGPNLVITGTRRDAASKRRYRQMEIFCGDFSTSVTLEEIVDRAGVSSSYRDGFLEVILPKCIPPACKE